MITSFRKEWRFGTVEVWDNKTSLAPPLFIAMPVLSQENDRAVIYQKVIK
jgi:hypothetical protein